MSEENQEKEFEDFLNNLDTSEPTEMRQVTEGFSFDKDKSEKKKDE